MKKGIMALFSVLTMAVLMTGCGSKKSEETVSIKETAAPKRPNIVVMKEVRSSGVTKAGMKVSGDEITVADFDSGEKPNNIGGDFGGWDKDPADFSQSCSESFDSVNRYGLKGFAMKLDYDVDSKNPAYNGFWMFLQNLDASGYDNLTFRVKGDSEKGYTTVFKVELKNAAGQVGRHYVTNATDKWQGIVMPLKDFKGITDFSNLTEFVIVFEDRIASNKKGVIYIDNIKFTKNK